MVHYWEVYYYLLAKHSKKINKKLKTVIDVRTPQEFMGGNVQGSINIPLQVLPQRIEEVKNMPQPIVLCCASGMRSGQAVGFLQQNGVDCINGGSWLDL